ncbi:MAG: EpsI family protein [Deltaproteobacteria bacterium]
MGQVSRGRILILFVLLLGTGVFISQKPILKTPGKSLKLCNILWNIKGWPLLQRVPLNTKVINALRLDDYLNRIYSNGRDNVFLYIGYYGSLRKIGAAHDPLVCFPGQGWTLSDIHTGSLILEGVGQTISYSAMIAQEGERRELVLYWFQSYDRTNPGTFSQKITSLWQKMTTGSEDTAFIRLSTPIAGNSRLAAQEVLNNFIRNFYPEFLDFIKSA